MPFWPIDRTTETFMEGPPKGEEEKKKKLVGDGFKGRFQPMEMVSSGVAWGQSVSVCMTEGNLNGQGLFSTPRKRGSDLKRRPKSETIKISSKSYSFIVCLSLSLLILYKH